MQRLIFVYYIDYIHVRVLHLFFTFTILLVLHSFITFIYYFYFAYGEILLIHGGVAVPRGVSKSGHQGLGFRVQGFQIWAFAGQTRQTQFQTVDQGHADSRTSRIQLPAPSETPTSEATLLICSIIIILNMLTWGIPAEDKSTTLADWAQNAAVSEYQQGLFDV